MAATISTIVLAAGSASRFGAPKLAADLHGRPLLQHALLAARTSDLGPVWLVTGSDEIDVLRAADGMADHVVANPDFQSGMGSSIAAGVAACRRDADAIIILLGDQPLITAEHLRRIAATWTGADHEIVATEYGDAQGPPALFAKGAFDRLSSLESESGARSLFSEPQFDLLLVDSAATADVDTPQDLAALQGNQ